MSTGISWTDETWNPTRGCTRVSAGCEHCYAEKVAHRFSGPGQPYEGLTRDSGRWSGKIRLVPEALEKPLRWRKPRRVFVDSMSDLFHPDVPDDYIGAVFWIMARSEQHTFQVLTKRPERMLRWFQRLRAGADTTCAVAGCENEVLRSLLRDDAAEYGVPIDRGRWCGSRWPLPNVWLGVSCEDQAAADERIPLLLQTPAAVRFVSAEPLLGQIDFAGRSIVQDGQTTGWSLFGPPYGGLSWIIAGGESGPGGRPCHVEWIRSIVEQCREAKVACWVKQLGARPVFEFADWLSARIRSRKGDDPSEWPEDLRVQEFPEDSHS